MGVENNEAVLAITWDESSIAKAKDWISQLDQRHQRLFAFVPALTNGKETVILAPDGSKKGWSTANEIQELRDSFVKFLDSDDVWFTWVEVGFGEYGQTVLRGNNSNCYGDDYAA
tara:strand:- start:676 stop:1020 length:345 start_codon:yes stop_codon:yes gene_type:complete